MAIYDSGVSFQATATNATSAVATQAAAAGKTNFIFGFSGSSDKAGALILIKDGTTVIWQDRISNTCPLVYAFPFPLRPTVGAAVSCTVDGTALCNSNIIGITM